MSTRPKGYFIDGERVPGVTTILGSRQDPGGLIHWAWDLGMKGIDYREARDAAADAGKVAHAMIQAWLKHEKYEADVPEPIAAKAKQGFESFLEWAAAHDLAIRDTEVELLSRKHRFGGRLDAVAELGGRLTIPDWKTGNSLYVDSLLQVEAYRMLWEENHPDEPIRRVDILRIGKDHADFHHHSIPLTVLTIAREQFLRLRAAYDTDKQLKAFVK